MRTIWMDNLKMTEESSSSKLKKSTLSEVD